MRTDQLIEALAADAATPGEATRPAAMRRRLLGAAGLGLAFAAAAVAGLFGVRPDLVGALATAPVLLKFAGSAAFAAGGLWLVARAGEPGRRWRWAGTAEPLLLAGAGSG
jgi:Uncharacterized protein conserved in bacteria